MTPHDLIAAFEKVSEAPDGVKRLRELVLQLAVRGKLVPQDPEDEPASVLLDRIDRRREELLRAKAMRKPKAVGRPDSNQAPFTVPNGWAWTRLGGVLRLCGNGVSVRPNDDGEGYRLLRISAATGQPGFRVDLSDHRFGVVEPSKAEKYLVQPGDLLACRFNGNLHYVGAVGFVPDEIEAPYLHPDKLIRLQAIEICHRYLMYSINSEPTRVQLREVAATTAGNIGINGKQLQGFMVPIPPLAEQRRIVARVDELMGLLDRLETARTARDATRQAARDAILAALSDADTAEDVEIAWTRFAERLDALVRHPDDIPPVRQAVLQLAVRGKLVPQDPEDEPAIRLVERGRRELAKLPPVRGRKAATNHQSGDAALHVCEPEEVVVPRGWTVASLADVSRLESGHTPDRKVPEYWGGLFPWIGIRDARRCRNGVVRDTEKAVTQDGINNSATRLLPEGTVCLSRTASVGYAVIMGGKMCTSQDFVNFVCTDSLLPQYLLTIFRAEYDALRRFAKGAVHLTIYFPEVKAFHILLPPLAEQHRIVARVDALMGLLDRLEQRLRAATEAQTAFAAAAVHHLDA